MGATSASAPTSTSTSNPPTLTTDIALKLRIANGTHTALAHVMALSGLTRTDVLSADHDTTTNEHSKVLVRYIDSLFHQQIKEALKVTGNTTTTNESALVASPSSIEIVEADAVYEDWRQRLLHGHFGLSTFFITQNGASKGGIRLGPTIIDLIQAGKPITCSTVFAVAALLRFLTPTNNQASHINRNGIYKGWLDTNKSIDAAVAATDTNTNTTTTTNDTVVYADGLSYNLKEQWYEFRCTNRVDDDDELTGSFDGCTKTLVGCLGSRNAQHSQPIACQYNIHLYLIEKECGNLSIVKNTPAYQVFLKAVSTVYASMISNTNDDTENGKMMAILKEMDVDADCESLASYVS